MADALKLSQMATLMGMMGQGAAQYNPGQQRLLEGLIGSSQGATQAEAQKRAEEKAAKKAKKQKAIKAGTAVAATVAGALTGGLAAAPIAAGGLGAGMGTMLGASMGSTVGSGVGDLATGSPDTGAAKLSNAAMQGLAMAQPGTPSNLDPESAATLQGGMADMSNPAKPVAASMSPRGWKAAGYPGAANNVRGQNLRDYYMYQHLFGGY